MEPAIKVIIPGHNKIAFLNYKGENNCFMNSVFQMFFNIDELRNWLDAVLLADTNDDMADRLKKLISSYLQAGDDDEEDMGNTKRIITENKKDTFVDIKKFRKAFWQIYPSVGEMKNTGDAALFWSALVQIVNSILITGKSNQITTVSNPDDNNCSMLYDTIGIKFVESRNSGDFEVIPHYLPYIQLDASEVVNMVQDMLQKEELSKDKNKLPSNIEFDYNFFKYWKIVGKFGASEENRNDITLTLENDPKLITFHTYVGKILEGSFGPDQINLFAKLLPLRISQHDVFDDYADDSLDDDFSDEEGGKVLTNRMYILRGIILYGNDHYFTW
jgi:hypothetical protein